MSAAGTQALVTAWQSGASSRDTLLHTFRIGEILPSARPNEQEMELIRKEPAPIVPVGAMRWGGALVSPSGNRFGRRFLQWLGLTPS